MTPLDPDLLHYERRCVGFFELFTHITTARRQQIAPQTAVHVADDKFGLCHFVGLTKRRRTLRTSRAADDGYVRYGYEKQKNGRNSVCYKTIARSTRLYAASNGDFQ